MADKKISALPASTTPLAGSEVLPIVQSGSTKQVSVANLTAGRGVSGSSFTTTAGNFVAAENFGLSFGVGSTYVYGSTTSGFIRLDVNNATAFGVDSSRDATVNVGNLIFGTAGKGITTGGATALGLGVNGAVTAMTIDTAGNVGIGESAPDYKLDVNGAIGFTPGASVTPVDNGDVVFELTNNTTLTVKAKGSDGVVRSGTIILV